MAFCMKYYFLQIHCFRRRSREQICKKAQKLVDQRYGEKEYNLLLQNCQHFAGECAIEKKRMFDKDHLIEVLVKCGIIVSGFLAIFGAIVRK